MAFVSSHSPNSTNEATTDFGVSTASTQVSTANLSDAIVYAFLANQPNRSQLMHEDLEQIHEDDLEEIDLKCFPYEWNTHVVVWRNKSDLDTMSLDDLYNNFKIVEQEEEMKQENIQTSGTTKFPILKQGPVTANEKIQKKNDVKARSMLLMALSNERFEDPDYPDNVYKVDKAFHGLHQDPRAWYKTLAKYLLDNGFHRGKIDQTLFIKRQKEDILLVQVKTRTKIRRMGIRIPQPNVPSSVSNEAITKEMRDGLGRATTTASSLEAEQGSGNISRSGEGIMQLLELIDICTKLSDKVTELKNKLKSTKTVYNKDLITLTKRVKKLEKNLKHKRRRAVVDSSEDEEASLDKEDSPKQNRMIEEINEDENVNMLKSSKQWEANETARHRTESDDTEVVDFSTASPKKDDDEITLAETLVNIKKSAAKDNGKAIMQESEPPKEIKKKEMIQISLDEEIAQRFYKEDQAQLLMDEQYAQQVQAEWVSDEVRIAQENLAQVEQ
nr:putative ribonuclease H-like domain-containing protein [Tanacetum cinerariifolium]